MVCHSSLFSSSFRLFPCSGESRRSGAARYADGKPQAASASAPGMRLPSPKRVARSASESTDKGRCIPKRSARGNVRKRSLPVVPYRSAIDNDTQEQQACSNTITGHCLTESSAEIDQTGTRLWYPDRMVRQHNRLHGIRGRRTAG